MVLVVELATHGLASLREKATLVLKLRGTLLGQYAGAPTEMALVSPEDFDAWIDTIRLTGNQGDVPHQN